MLEFQTNIQERNFLLVDQGETNDRTNSKIGTSSKRGFHRSIGVHLLHARRWRHNIGYLRRALGAYPDSVLARDREADGVILRVTYA